MADATQLARISKKVRAIDDFTIPPVPAFADWFVRRFELGEYAADWERWRQNTQIGVRDALTAAKELNDLILSGTGSPEGRIASSPGKIYLNLAGGAGATIFVKETGTGVIGWVAK